VTKLNVNGKTVEVDVDPQTPLLWVLRDTLGLTGTKQCGYCQSGQIMSASALLASKPRPSDADIDAAMSGNICRCGTYQRIRSAIRRAAEIKSGA
jgi:isoquinoline 1-oxidoreductase alpha subunit